MTFYLCLSTPIVLEFYCDLQDMKPFQTVGKLRQIAAAIENSKRPDRNLVAEDLKKIIANLTEPDTTDKPETEPEKS
jgi:hypothetical protein